MTTRTAMHAALKASSRATVRPIAKPYPSELERRYRYQAKQVEAMLGLSPVRKEGAAGQVIGTVGALLGYGIGLIALFHILSRI